MTFVLDISVRVVVAALAVAVVLRVLRVDTASVRHAAWTVVLAAMLLMPLLPSVVPAVPLPSFAPMLSVEPMELSPAPPSYRPSQNAPAPSPGSATPTPSVETMRAAVSASARAKSTSWRQWIPSLLVGMYVAGLALSLGRLLYGWRLVSRMIHRSKRFGSAPYLESPEVAVPLTAGAIRPVIVLPATSREWPADTLDAVLAHEMAHVRRRDPLIALLARVNCAIFWFHPLAWWLERQLAVTAEHACDEAAARVVIEPRRYAEILVEMADAVRRNRGRIAWQAVGVNGPGLLQGRIERVLRGAPSHVSRARALTTLAVCAAAIVLVVACRQPSAQASPLREDPDLAKRLVEQDERTKQFEAARDMKQEQADALEQRLAANPQDVDARDQLVWYYTASSEVKWDKKVPGIRRHALWLIENQPEGTSWIPSISPQYDPEGFATAKKLWEAHLANRNASPYLVYRAAQFFTAHDKPYAEQLIMRGMKTDPESAALKARVPPNLGMYQWPSQLASLYASALMGSERTSGVYNDTRSRLAHLNTPYAQEVQRKLEASTDAKLLASVGTQLVWRPREPAELQQMGKRYLERALQLDPTLESAKAALFRATGGKTMTDADRLANRAVERFSISEDITEYAKKDPDKAKSERAEVKKEAEQVLAIAKAHAGDAEYSAAVMTAHQVLASLALRDGDRERAIQHLHESVKVPTSDQIKYATPWSWMRVVNRLLKEGERERVAQFLDAFSQLVGTGREADRLRNDAKAIREGRMPTAYQQGVHRETHPSPFKAR